ncbi:NAD-P-binding protein [Meredithblackwellia eburnea MCA 4105]
MTFGDHLACIAPNSDASLNFFPPSSKFDPQRDMADMTGKVIIVTGGNSGLGYFTALHLVKKNARVYIATRNAERAQEAISKLKSEARGGDARFLQVDLGDMNSVRKAAEEFLEREKVLDVLVNNAGIMAVPKSMISAQGYDAQWATNVMGPYLFTKLLMPALRESHLQSGRKARIVNLSSALLRQAPNTPTGVEWKSLKAGKERDATIKSWGAMTAYGQSKLANVTLSNVFRTVYGNDVTSCSVHPGVLRSNLSQHMGKVEIMIVNTLLAAPTEMGSLTILFGATASDETVDGKYLIPWARVGPAPEKAEAQGTQNALLEWLEKETESY